MGFRGGLEFDKKRILLASKEEIAIFGYDQLERPFEILNEPLEQFIDETYQDSEVILVGFIEEFSSKYIILVGSSKKQRATEFLLFKLSMNNEGEDTSNNRSQLLKSMDISSKDYI